MLIQKKKNLLIGNLLGELKLGDNRDTNMSEQPVEQITREPDVKDRVKDPKKVEAGKKLAEYHKKAKDALKEKEQRNADSQKEKEQPQQEDDAWLPSLSFKNLLIGGSIIGVIGYGLYERYKDRIPNFVPSVTFEPPPVKDMNEVKTPPKIETETSLNDELM